MRCFQCSRVRERKDLPVRSGLLMSRPAQPRLKPLKPGRRNSFLNLREGKGMLFYISFTKLRDIQAPAALRDYAEISNYQVGLFEKHRSYSVQHVLKQNVGPTYSESVSRVTTSAMAVSGHGRDRTGHALSAV